MQTIWKGSVSFGLVSIPVKLYSATEERSVSFRQVHAADGGRIRYRRVCEIDGEEVAYRDIAKGYDLPDGETIVLTDEDFANLPLTTSRTVDVLQFVPVEQVDPVYVNRSYYLQADGAGLKPYVLLRDALESSGKAALVKVALRNREALAVLRPRGEVLMMQTMLWPDEVRDPAVVAPDGDVEIRSQEAAMATAYIDTLSGDLELADYTDEYRAALEELVMAKAAGREFERVEEGTDSGVVVDLMEALRQSVEAAKQGRADAAEPAPATKTAAKAPAVQSKTQSKTPAKRTSKAVSEPAAAGSRSRTEDSGRTASAESARSASGKSATTRKKAAAATKAVPVKQAATARKRAAKAEPAKTTAGREEAAEKSATASRRARKSA
jgi:DNA end-binding protein Ku